MSEINYESVLDNAKLTEKTIAKSGVDIIFIGNPGAGKSTLVSSLSGGECERGVNFGAGLTAELQWCNDAKGRNIRWADTPGVACLKHAEAAAQAISVALNDSLAKGRGVKLIFVCLVDAGRVRTDDIYTAEKVLSSIKLQEGKNLPDNCYSVLFNKFSKSTYARKKFIDKGRNQMEACFKLKSDKLLATTVHIDYIFKNEEMEDEDDALFTDEKQLLWLERTIILNSSTIVDLGKVNKIDTRNLKQKLDEAKERISNEYDKKLEVMQLQNEHEIEKLKLREEQIIQSQVEAEKRHAEREQRMNEQLWESTKLNSETYQNFKRACFSRFSHPLTRNRWKLKKLRQKDNKPKVKLD